MMAVAVTLSGLLQWLWMYLHCRALGVTPLGCWPRFTPQVKALFRAVGPGAIGAGATQINLALSTVLASLAPTGAVSYLFYADRLNQLPLGVIGIAISSTLLPLLSARVQAGDDEGMRHYTTRAVEFGMILGLPAALGLGIAAHPIIKVLFEHGAFDSAATTHTAAALAAYVFGVVPFILVKVFSAIFFAHHDTKTPVATALAAVAVNVLAAIGLSIPFGFVGIAAATSIATWVNVLLLGFALKRARLLRLGADIKQRGLKISAAALAMAVFLGLGRGYVESQLLPHQTLANGLKLSLYLGSAMVVYLGMLLGSRAVAIKAILRGMAGKPKATPVNNPANGRKI